MRRSQADSESRLNPRLYRMVFDILRFNLFALDILNEEGSKTDEMSIGEYLEREGYGDGFKEDYLLVSSAGPSAQRIYQADNRWE